jgi:hypothetical protein
MSGSSKKQVTKRQHYLPQTSYLDHFTVDGRVLRYWYKDGDKADFMKTATQKRIAPINVGVETDLYETPKMPTNTIEKALASLEGKYGKILEEKILKQKSLSDADEHIVSQYVSMLEARVPAKFDNFKASIDEIADKMKKLSIIHTGNEDAAKEKLAEMDEAREEVPATTLIAAAEVNRFGVLDLCFLVIPEATDASFITSDNPVTQYDFTIENGPYGIPLGSKTAEHVVVLSPKVALFGNSCGISGYAEIDYNYIREINHRVIVSSNKMLVAKNEIPEYEAKVTLRRRPQSLLLNFLDLPNGKMDELVAKADSE